MKKLFEFINSFFQEYIESFPEDKRDLAQADLAITLIKMCL